MTAIVGILNTKGIAIAADSAVTFSNANNKVVLNKKGEKVILSQDKVINSGDKMLRLKDKQPVAIMIVGCSLLKNIPWDVIIRWYRKQKDDSGFPHFQDYIDDFMAFVSTKVVKPYIKKADIVFDEAERTYLVFTGYGKDDPMDRMKGIVGAYMIAKSNNRSFKILFEPYSKLPKSVVISDKRKSTVFASGSPDIIVAIQFGIQKSRIESVSKSLPSLLKDLLLRVDILDLHEDIIDEYLIHREVKKLIEENRPEHYRQWLRLIKGYNLQEMACLAENLIKATELHRKITFQQESVGGLIDLAIITKNDGFQWLNRKSWYEPSRGGQYGKFGI